MNMQLKEYSKELNIENLHENVAQLVDLVGLENTLKIVATFGGTEVYIPKIERQMLHVRDERIRKAFNGGNYKELALKYGLSENRIRKIIDCTRLK